MKQLLILPILITLFLLANSCQNDVDLTNYPINLEFGDNCTGCASFVVYKYSLDATGSIAIIGNRNNLSLTTDQQTFDLSTVATSDLKVELLEFDGEAGSYYCDDVAGDDGVVENRWLGVSGMVNIQIVQDSVNVYPWAIEYIIDVQLDNVTIQKEGGDETLLIEQMDCLNVYVGWLPG